MNNTVLLICWVPLDPESGLAFVIVERLIDPRNISMLETVIPSHSTTFSLYQKARTMSNGKMCHENKDRTSQLCIVFIPWQISLLLLKLKYAQKYSDAWHVLFARNVSSLLSSFFLSSASYNFPDALRHSFWISIGATMEVRGLDVCRTRRTRLYGRRALFNSLGRFSSSV